MKVRYILIDLDHTLFNVNKFLKDTNKSFFKDEELSKYLYDDVINFIEYSKKYGAAYIFSEGDVDFQNKKIKNTGLSEIFGKNLKIYPSYAKMSNAKSEFFGKNVILVDDNPTVIYKAKKLGWRAIRVRRGKHRGEKDKIVPDITVRSLDAIVTDDLFSELK